MLEKGKWVPICCFKHDGSVHRIWDKTLVLEHTDGLLVVGNDSASVLESDGRTWQVREPAITFFFKDRWYNIICMFRQDGIHYYINIASPYIIEENNIIYIDYDLDVGIKPNQALRVLDEAEYARHRQQMGYSDQLDLILKEALYDVIKKSDKHEFPFTAEYVQKYYEEFMKLK